MRIGIVLLLASVAAGVFALIGRADNPRFDQIQASLAPSFVNAGGDVLYTAQWHYIDNRTLVHASISISVPAGWLLVDPSDPAGCIQSGTTITCDVGTIRQGDYVRQAVELRTDSDLGTQAVDSVLNFYESPFNPGRIQRLAQDTQYTLVISASQTDEPNRAGNCVDDHGGTVSTAPGVGGSSSSANVPATTTMLCTPFTVQENARSNATEACFTGLECVSDIVVTNAPTLSTANPIVLTLIYYGTGLNTRPLIFNGGQPDELIVPACTGSGATPDPCYFGHVSRQQSVTWSVRWSGRDPSWTS